MILRLKTSHKIRNHTKFGIMIPTTIEEEKALDLENGNELWEVALQKELDKVKVSFHLLEEDDCPPIGSKLINYHIIFDVKIELTIKARFVTGGNLNIEVPKHNTYSSVVSK